MADPKQEPNETEDEAARRKARRAARRAARQEAREAAEAEAAGAGKSTDDHEAAEGDDEPTEGDEEATEGTDEEAAEAADGEEAAEAPARPNRRERRRQKKAGDPDAPPRDRNARVRAEARRARREEPEENLTPLSTGEMIDDALARGTASLGKWAQRNAGLLQFLVIALVLGGAAFGVHHWRSTEQAEKASDDLMAAMQADHGRIDPAGPKPKADEEEILPVYRSAADRNAAALAAYRKAYSDRKDAGTALLARLGEAGVLLDQRSYDQALEAYREVKASPLAAADPDVRGRAIEGIGFALEGKGDLDGALKVYKELDTITGIKSFKELGFYHQARLLAAKGDKDGALKMAKEARERLQTTGESRSSAYLVGVLDDLQRKLDPTAAPKRSVGGAGKQLSVEELQKIQQQMMRELQKAQEKGEHSDEH